MNRPVRWLYFFALLIILPVTLPGKDSPIYAYRLTHLPDAQVREILQRYNRSFDQSRAADEEYTSTYLTAFFAQLPTSLPSTRAEVLRHFITGHVRHYGANRDSVFHHYQTAVVAAQRLPRGDVLKAVAHLILGRHFAQNGVSDLALDHLRIAGTAYRQSGLPHNHGFDNARVTALTTAFSLIGAPDSIRVHYEAFIARYRDEYAPNQFGYACNDLGFYLAQAGDCSGALRTFERGLDCIAGMTREPDIMSRVNLLESRAHCYVEMGMRQEALSDLDLAFAERKRFGRNAWALQALGYIIRYLRESGRTEAALAKYEERRPFIELNYEERASHQTYRYHEEMGKLMRELGRDQEAIFHEHRYLQYVARHPEVIDPDKDNRQLATFMNLRNESYEQRVLIGQLNARALQRELRTRNLVIVLTLLAAVLLTLVGVFLYRQKRQRYRHAVTLAEQNERILELENDKLRLDILARERDLGRIATDNKARLATKKEVLKSIKRIGELDERERDKQLHSLERDLAEAIGNQGALSELQSNLDEVNDQFERQLRLLVPGITAQEVRVCSLMRIGMDNVQIASLLSKSDSALKMMRYRVRKKAGWTAAEMLARLREI